MGTAWLEMNAIGLDPLLLLAAAAKQTERIGLGTAILPAFSRHPVALATQALSLEGLAPGRLRLGIGTGNSQRMAQAFHHPTDRPLARLREYVQIVRSLLREGRVRFAGEFYSADAQIGEPPMTPVLLSALGRADDRAGVREQVRRDLSGYVRVPVLARMLTEAGYRVTDGEVTDDLLDELAVIGDEDAVATRLTWILEQGVDELMVSLTPETHNRDQEAALLRVLGAIGAGWRDRENGPGRP